jgi:transposase
VIRFFRKSLIREEAMEHVAGRSRYQSELMPPSLDEVIGFGNVVRVIDGFVDGLDLRRLEFQRVETAATGRPPYAPGDLLKLYIYGYMNQMRSSRRLEREAQRNLEVCWLIDRLRPSFKTIADFGAITRRRSSPPAASSYAFAAASRCWAGRSRRSTARRFSPSPAARKWSRPKRSKSGWRRSKPRSAII